MTASRKVWHFDDLSTWRNDVLKMLTPLVDFDVIAEFRRRPPKYVVSDDLSWLDNIIKRVKKMDANSKWYLAERLIEKYDVIRAYHGARPLDVSSYYIHGLQTMDPEKIEQQARDFFLSVRFPELTLEAVKNAIAGVGKNLREGRVYFEATKRMLEDHCAHYMLYGSEFITGVAAGLWRHGRDYRQELKTIGKPTVFVCDVPLAWMDGRLLQEYAGAALEAIFESILDTNYHHPPNGRGSGVILKRTLPPEFIVSHYFPKRLADPLLGRRFVDC